MPEQMTGRKGPVGERPADAASGSSGPSGPSGPSPRDLAARSPHREPARTAPAQPHPAETDQTAAAQPQGAEPPRAQVASPGKTRATGAQALVYALERVRADVVFGIPGGAVLLAYDPLLDSKA